MSIYWNKRVQALKPYVPGEQPANRNLIKLNTNENPYPPSPKVIEAIQRAAGDRLRLYPDPACTELREAIAQKYGVKPEQVFVGNGSDEVLAFVFGAFFGSRAGCTADGTADVLFPDISYSFYPVYAGLWDLPFRTVALRPDFSIDPAAYREPCGGIIFPNPNAPTGMALPAAAVLSLAEYQERQVLVLDEAYVDFGAESVIPYLAGHPNLLAVHTLSKSACLAGLRLGFAIGSAELIEALCRMRDSFNSYPVDYLAQAGATAAIRDWAYYEEVNRRVVKTREWVAAALVADGFEVLPSKANFLFIRSCRQGGAALFEALREQGILVRRFNAPRIGDFLRVSIGTDDAMDRFLSFLPAAPRVFLPAAPRVFLPAAPRAVSWGCD
jgi:histidinol-phosphate aminotransferase